MRSILIVEDDITFSLMLTTWLGKKGFRVQSVSSVKEAKQRMEGTFYDLVLSDLRLPDGDGIALLHWMKSQCPTVPVILMTGYAEIQSAVLAMKSGAADYIAKPLNPEELLNKINESLASNAESVVSQASSSSLPEPNLYIEGQSAAARVLYEHVRLVAPTDMSVLVTGASGTGKEYVARRIHAESGRSKAPFVAVDCGAIPKDLAASEFFGHVKGSFTGAIDHKTGAFVAADGGTIFLDEIGNLSYAVQVQLLRALQERKVRPIGSNQEIPINVRLISATNENLRAAIEKGEFREDLYHRINEFSIRIPGLKERPEDLLLFANHFLDLANSELRKEVVGFDRETIQLFQSYAWPGNLRQMKNVVKYATLLASGRYITRQELPEELLESISKPSTTDLSLHDETHERALILKALAESGNNKTRAAMLLGIDRKTLYNKLKNYQLN
ncbi:sigma-54-dependent Fis family transcriptional regulator [Parabacteroides distasonis]|nr:sigma-54-dependent Fis family transcriptional regulator [Parabacteroides distasonis]